MQNKTIVKNTQKRARKIPLLGLELLIALAIIPVVSSGAVIVAVISPIIAVIDYVSCDINLIFGCPGYVEPAPVAAPAPPPPPPPVPCTNGANNPNTCDQCPDGNAWDGASCVACSNGGCTGAGGNPSDWDGSLLCANLANNPPACSQCPNSNYYNTVAGECQPCSGAGCTGAGSVTDYFGGMSCLGGATGMPSCTSCQSLQIFNGSACVTSIGNNNCDTDAGENSTNALVDCKPKTKFWQF